MKTVFVYGAFNVLHPGHLRFLRYAKDLGDKLIVGVLSDQVAGPAAHISENYRLEAIESNRMADQVILIDGPIEEVIETLRPDIVVKGKEFEKKYNPEMRVIKKYGGKLLFSSGEAMFSSLDLIRGEINSYLNSVIINPKSYLQNHNISSDKLIRCINNFSNLHVCVIGDLIIDEYISCEPLGMSQEDPTLVVSPIDSVKFIGGAGIVAAHAAGLGAKVTFISVSGEDQNKEFALDALVQMNVNSNIFSDIERPTTHKKRYRAHGKTLLRVSHLHQGAISKELQSQIIDKFEEIVAHIDLMVFSDFNYGCLPQDLIVELIKIAKKHGVFCSADSQSSSQVGNIGRFKDVDLITPTEREARISVRNIESGLVTLSEQLMADCRAKFILLKLGADGALIQIPKSPTSSWVTDRIPALNSNPKDVAGAGDSLLIATSLSLSLGASIWESALIGSIAAAIQVSRIGNIPLKSDELIRDIYGLES